MNEPISAPDERADDPAREAVRQEDREVPDGEADHDPDEQRPSARPPVPAVAAASSASRGAVAAPARRLPPVRGAAAAAGRCRAQRARRPPAGRGRRARPARPPAARCVVDAEVARPSRRTPPRDALAGSAGAVTRAARRCAPSARRRPAPPPVAVAYGGHVRRARAGCALARAVDRLALLPVRRAPAWR